MDAHIIKNENLSILFLPNSYRYFEINDLTEKIILEIDSGINMSNTIEKYNISEKLYKEIFNLVNDISEPIIKSNDNDKHLFKLVLHITNTCNLNCLYCYADGGMYNSKR